MARTDALAVEGLERAIERARACVEAGAGAIFPEAMTDLSMYRKFADAVGVPVARQPYRVWRDAAVHCGGAALRQSGDRALPALGVSSHERRGAQGLQCIRREGTQKNVVDAMQTRADLYDVLDYHAYERKLDELFAKDKGK